MALVTLQRSLSAASFQDVSAEHDKEKEEEINRNELGTSECYFAGKATALVLNFRDVSYSIKDRRKSTDSIKSVNSNNSDIQQHLQSMFYLLRNEETLKMAVKLESQRPGRTRYLAIVSRICNSRGRKSNCHSQLSIKLEKSSRSRFQQQQQQQSNVQQEVWKNDEDAEVGMDGSSYLSISGSNLDLSSSTTSLGGLESSSAKYQRVSSDNSAAFSFEEACLLGIDCNENTTIGLVLKLLADTTIRLDGDGGFTVTVYGKTHVFKPVSVQAMWSALQTLHKVSQNARECNFYPGGPSHDWATYYENKINSDRSCLNEWNAMDSIESRRPPSPDTFRNKPTKREETETIIRMRLKEIMMSVDLDEVTSKYIRSKLESLLEMNLNDYKPFIDAEMLTILGQMDAPTEIFDHVYLGSEWNASNLEELKRNGVKHILNVTREIDNFFPGIFDYFNVRVYDDEKTNLLKHWDNTFKYISRARAEGSKVLVHCKMGVSRSASVVIAYAMKAYNWEFERALGHVKERRSCIKPNKNFLSQLETYRGMLDAMKNREKLQRSKSETNLKSTKDARLLAGSEPTPLIQALYNVKKSDSRKISNNNSSKRSSSFSPRKEKKNTCVNKQQSQSLDNISVNLAEVHDEQKHIRVPGNNGQHYSVTQNQALQIQRKIQPAIQAVSVNKLIDLPETSNENENQQVDVYYNTITAEGNESSTKRRIFNVINTKTLEASTGVVSQDSVVIKSTEKPPADERRISAHRKTKCFPPTKNREYITRHASWGSGDAPPAEIMQNKSFCSCEKSFFSNLVSENMLKSAKTKFHLGEKNSSKSNNENNEPASLLERSHDLQDTTTCHMEILDKTNQNISSRMHALKQFYTYSPSKTSGNVQNLKMNFEAKSVIDSNKRMRSLPSSPVALHPRSKCNQHPDVAGVVVGGGPVDINVKCLVNKYQSSESRKLLEAYRVRPKSFHADTYENANAACGPTDAPQKRKPPVSPTQKHHDKQIISP